MTLVKGAGSEVPMLSAEQVFKSNKNFHIHLSTDYTEFEGRLHSHSFVEISHVVSGEAEHEIGGARYNVHRGDIIVIKPGVPHAFRPIECDEPFVAYDMMFVKGFVGSAFDDACSMIYNPESEKDIHLSGIGYQFFGELFHKAYSEYCGKQKGYMELIRAYATELVVNLIRKREHEGEDRISLRLRNAVRSTVAYIEKNYTRHITLEELSSRIYFSKDYLSKVFREATGMTVGAYLQKVRLKVASGLLLDTDKTVMEIAEESGFGDVKSFYTVFKREMKMTPGEYRG